MIEKDLSSKCRDHRLSGADVARFPQLDISWNYLRMGASAEELSPSNWPVGKSMGHFIG